MDVRLLVARSIQAIIAKYHGQYITLGDHDQHLKLIRVDGSFHISLTFQSDAVTTDGQVFLYADPEFLECLLSHLEGHLEKSSRGYF